MTTNRGTRVSRLGIGVAGVLIALVAVAALAWVSTTRTDQPPSTSSQLPSGFVPNFTHVYLIVLENRPYVDVIGKPAAPALNALVAQGALATNYHSVGRPSQPNYIALVSGSTHGITDDGVHELDAPNLADQLEAKNLSWAVSAENLPSSCFAGATASGGTDGAGNYARKHEPFVSFMAIGGNPDRCGQHIHGLAAFDPAEAAFQLIVPNLCHDAHDCALQVADSWLAAFVPKIVGSAAFADGGVLFITFDEADFAGDQVPMIALGTGVRAGTQSADARNHYAWLRTVQDAWGLPCLASSCGSGNLSGLFRAP